MKHGLNVRCTPEEKARWEQKAKVAGLSVSGLIRKLLGEEQAGPVGNPHWRGKGPKMCERCTRIGRACCPECLKRVQRVHEAKRSTPGLEGGVQPEGGAAGG